MNINLKQEINRLHAQFCSALSDPNRILILYTLAEHATNVTDLAEHLDVPQPTISRHLKVLKERGMVTSTREGQLVYYEVADQRILEALDLLRAILADNLKTQVALSETLSTTQN